MSSLTELVENSSDPNSLLQLYVGFTLVDITNTNITNAQDSIANPKGRNQQRNWETVVQTIGLRSQPIVLEPPTVTTGDISAFEFGNAYSGKQKIWMFKFGTEHASVYDLNGQAGGVLLQDFSTVPIITGLDETASIHVPAFVTAGPHKNIHFALFKSE